MTAADAERYFVAYEAAIHAIGRAAGGRGMVAGPGISMKLSALHPRFCRAQRERVLAELSPQARHAGATREALRHRPRDRCGGGRPPRAFAGPPRPARRGPGARGLGRPGLRRPVLPEARAADDRLDRRARAAASAAPDAAAGQGRVLGRGDQARAGRRSSRVPGLHAQGAHRRRLPRLREGDARGPRCDLSAVREPQRVHDRGGARARRRRAIRVPVPARDGREHLRRGRREGEARSRLSHLRAGRLARDAARVPRAAPPRERRQQLVRQPHRRSRGQHRLAGRRPGFRRAGDGRRPALRHRAADRAVARPPEFAGRRSRRRHGARRARARTRRRGDGARCGAAPRAGRGQANEVGRMRNEASTPIPHCARRN